MAEGTIISFTKKLGVIFQEEYKFLTGVEEQVASLRDELEWIHSFLRDATAHTERNYSERADVWMSQVRNIAYSAQDAIDIFIHKVMYERDRSTCLRIFSRLPFVSYPGPPIILHGLGNDIKRIKAGIERISANKSRWYEKQEAKADYLADYLGEDVIRFVPYMSDSIFGFDSQSNAVKAKLSSRDHEAEDSSQDSQLHVLWIVGEPGIGKSTLASKVYNEIKTQFDTCVWIDVSKDFREEDLLQNINKEKMPGKEDFGKLLVVFDDVRETQDWDEILVRVLGGISCMDKKGSRVLVTCRSVKVGRHASSRTESYSMEALNVLHGTALLKCRALVDQEEGWFQVGMSISDACGGIPLAIVLVGGLLSRKLKADGVWKKVPNILRRLREQGSSSCSAALALSYGNLPHYLSPCFLYLGLFPQGCLIDCESLIQLWIAEGFIEEEMGEKSMEDVANDFLLELIQRGMIQVHRSRSNASVEICRIHDIIGEIAISKGRHQKFLDIVGNKRLTKAANHTMPRRVAIHSSTSTTTDHGSEIPDGKTRSIICFADLSSRMLEKASFYRNLMYLRALDLRGSKELNKLPDEIGKLVLLKYLNLRGTQIRKLPSSVRKLLSLQTLDISETRIELTPYWLVWELKELRHFYANLEQVENPESSDDHKGGFGHRDFLRMVSCNSNAARQTKTNTRRLENLVTLSTREDGLICNIEFSGLTNLRKLKITDVDMVYCVQKIYKAIPKFVLLRELEIEWPKGRLKFPSFAQHVYLYKMRLSGIIELEGMAERIFPPNLIEAVLSHVMLDQDGIDALSKLKHLKFLELKQESFQEHTMVFPENGFVDLSRLDLEQLSELRELVMKENSLNSLEILNLCGLEKLMELPSGLKQVKTLRQLKISSMPPEFIAQTKKDEGIDWEKIQHVPTIAIIGN